MAQKNLVLGDEYDDDLFAHLVAALRGLDAKIGKKDEGIGGSQIVQAWEVKLAGRRFVIKGETYMGLSIEGDEADVDTVALMVAQRRI
jgi:hypothetical protein